MTRFVAAHARQGDRNVHGVWDKEASGRGLAEFARFGDAIEGDARVAEDLFRYALLAEREGRDKMSWTKATDFVPIDEFGKPINAGPNRYTSVRVNWSGNELDAVLDNQTGEAAMYLDESTAHDLNNFRGRARSEWSWTPAGKFTVLPGGPVPEPKARLSSALITRTIRIRHANGDEVVGFLEMYVYKKDTDTYAYSMRGTELAILEDDDVVEVL